MHSRAARTPRLGQTNMKISKLSASVVALGSLILLTSACAARNTTPAGSAPVSQAAAQYLGPITKSVSDPEASVILDVPPPTAQLALASMDSVMATCTSHESLCSTIGTPTISLVAVTTPFTGTAGPDGTIVPELNNTLAYDLQWTNVPCGHPGGAPRQAGPNTAAATSAALSECTVMNFIDAKTGKYLLTTSKSHL
jgi:hypothetical protein